jgi:hypothetical protein
VRDGGSQGPVDIVDRPDLQGENGPNAMFREVTPDYFAAMGIPILRGRSLTELDRAGTDLVTVVSEAFAQLAWPGQDPIGRRVDDRYSGRGPRTVVGVAREVKLESITGTNPIVMYVPAAQESPADGGVLVARTTGSSTALMADVRRITHELEPRVAIFRTADMKTVVDTALAEPLRLRFFLTLFAGLALVLGVVGIYSVVSYAVVRRRSEFGVRMALGAEPGRVLRQVVGRGLLPVAAGTAIGAAAALSLSGVAARFVYGVSPADPVALAVAVTALIGAGVGASVLPALRAARVNPVEALRSD